MNKITTLAFASLSVLALAACGSSDDASVEAEADTVEMPANEAIAPAIGEPIADPEAYALDESATGPNETVAEEADAAGDAAAAAAAEIQAMTGGAATPAAPATPD